jgi:hypothetical protein
MHTSPASQTSPTASPTRAISSGEKDPLDQYAREFAELVQQYPPRRGRENILRWLRRVPLEVFKYYRWGIVSYGRQARSPAERRGRLYLLHTTLLFMWMDWGRATAEKRFRNQTARGTRRAASLITLEFYRQAGTVEAVEIEDWFRQPVEDWRVELVRDAVHLSKASQKPLVRKLTESRTVSCPVDTFSELRSRSAVPALTELDLTAHARTEADVTSA